MNSAHEQAAMKVLDLMNERLLFDTQERAIAAAQVRATLAVAEELGRLVRVLQERP